MKMVFAITPLICGVILLINDNLDGLFLIAIGITIFFFKKGIEIELRKKSYRNFISLFGFRIGKWKQLPEIEYVSVFSTREFSLDPALRVDYEPGVSETYDIIHINLFYNTNRKITVFRTNNNKEAFKTANKIAQILNVDILDATEAESKWL